MILVFDAECVLCSRGVAFLLRHDNNRYFQFAPLQSATGRRLMEERGLQWNGPETMIVVDGEKNHYESAAMLQILSGLGWPWRAGRVLWLIPRPLRDAAYRWLARNRYRLFGKRTSCYLPPEEERSRFLD